MKIEQLNHHGLAEFLEVNSQMLKEKICYHSKGDLQKYGEIINEASGILLNIDQILYLVLSLKNVRIGTRIAFIRALLEGNKEATEVVSYEQIANRLISKNIENNVVNNPFKNEYDI